MDSAIIIGIGQFGTHVAKRMSELKCEVMAVDVNEDRINEILPYVTHAQIGDSTNPEFMKALGISNYDVCIVTIGNSFQTSLETTALVKELGAKVVVARAANDVQMKFLLRNGADDVIYPEKQTAMRVATKYASKTILDYIQLDSSISIYEMKVPREWNGKTLAQLDVRKKFNVNIIAVKRDAHLTVPAADMVMTSEDIALVIGERKNIQKCFKV